MFRSAFQAWRQCIYRKNLKRLCATCCQQRQTQLLQGWQLCLSYIIPLYIMLSASFKSRGSYIVVFNIITHSESFDKWVLETAIVAGEGILSSKLHGVWQQNVCQRALKFWLMSMKEAKALRAISQLQTRDWFNRWKW